ncbi:multiple epidermal growth factor-like domains protein 6 isoform X3 [Biomphalaria glabrata]|uniref:Multiple epidermal growth factor-like domains protein 6 isoform X3 n=1 Tax=Biomphalaria glabrata TaxID=6526 RepID=A0A9W3ACU5_BIOGL|nr:multiple epidermal growth factor-like domains protein 6 isoform X3 [Biomphalaria glabrata]
MDWYVWILALSLYSIGYSSQCNCELHDCLQGVCRRGAPCRKPYFGYHCQYLNEAADMHANRNLKFATDHDSQTCSDGSFSQLMFDFDDQHIFSFAEIVFKDLPLSYAHKKYDLHLQFLVNNDEANCDGMQIREVDSKTAIILCSKKYLTSRITLEGSCLEYICEFYISGGRNLAKDREFKSSPVSRLAAKVIDGDYTTCYTLKSVEGYPFFSVQIPFNVFTQRLKVHTASNGVFNQMILRFLDQTGREMRPSHTIANFKGKIMTVYDIILDDTIPAHTYMLTRYNISSAISFCELEIFGDCLEGYYGLACDAVSFNCVNKTNGIDGTCYVTTQDYPVMRKPCQGCPQKCNHVGLCSVSCTKGYKGPACNEICRDCNNEDPSCDKVTGQCDDCLPGWYGASCQLTCPNCGNTGTCDKHTGHCNWACKPGYLGEMCDDECTNCAGDGSCLRNAYCVHGCSDGFRGDNCILVCHNCAGRGTCERFEGKCHEGCSDGFQGNDCSNKCGNCKAGTTCNRFDGSCADGCQKGWKGVRCDVSCENCINGTCAQEDGKCLLGCKVGFTGWDCETHCSNCIEEDQSCDQKTRFCLFGCRPGYYEDDCSNLCETCGGTGECGRKRGECLDGCKEGFRGPLCRGSDSQLESSLVASTQVSLQ